MRDDKDYFEEYLEYFPDVPSLVLVRSVELKNFPKEFLKHPILDLCCGDGFFSKQLGLSEIYGCDIDNSAIKKAKDANVYKELKVCDVRDLSVYPDAYFQTIYSNCALEHVEEISIALSEISRVLARNGHLIMTVPSELLLHEFPPKKFFKSIGFGKLGEKLLYKYNHKQAHRNILSLTQWEKLLNESGLEVYQHFYLFDESSYKSAILCDWLLTLRVFGIINRFFRIIFSIRARKAIWRRFLKQYYLKSTPLKNGGELVIIAKK